MSRQDALDQFKTIGSDPVFGESVKSEDYVLTPPKPTAKPRYYKDIGNLREISPGFEPLAVTGGQEGA